MIKIYPSLISSDLLNLEQTIKLLEPFVAGFHLDVMDQKFVPNMGLGFDSISTIRKLTQKPLQVHLMVEYPEKYIDKLDLHPGDLISVHYESPSVSLVDVLNKIYLKGLVPSIAINPTTPIEALISLPAVFEHVLLMSVKPGFSGQKFLDTTFLRLEALVNFREAHYLSFKIEIDGGVSAHNIKSLKDLGADEFAAASSIFDQKNIVQAIRDLINN